MKQSFSGVATAILRDQSTGAISGIYHNTVVAHLQGDVLTLNTGGWRTATTKRRMNQFSADFIGGRIRVYAKNGDWYAHDTMRDKLYLFGGQTLQITL